MPKLTVTGPLTRLQVVCKVAGAGNPSSLAVPLKGAVAGKLML